MTHTRGHGLNHGVVGTLPRIRNGQVTPPGRRIPDHEFACLHSGLGFATLQQGHVPGALHLPHTTLNAATTAALPHDKLLVVYCWGPGCNGATKAAMQLSALGFAVKEMIGGMEYWEERERYPVERGQ